MQKEIHEQANVVANTLEERTANGKVLDAAFVPLILLSTSQKINRLQFFCPSLKKDIF